MAQKLATIGAVNSITLISVAAIPPVSLTPTEFTVLEYTVLLEQIAEGVVNKVTKENFEGIPVNCVVVNGDPGMAIAHYANDNGFNLIMMGSRGFSGVKGIMLGSVSHKVLFNANCPVWVYKS